MTWKGKKEFIRAGNGLVWAGILLWGLGFIKTGGIQDDRIGTYIMNSLMLLGLGAIVLGSAVFVAGRLREY